jgi:hypothetical protein
MGRIAKAKPRKLLDMLNNIETNHALRAVHNFVLQKGGPFKYGK